MSPEVLNDLFHSWSNVQAKVDFVSMPILAIDSNDPKRSVETTCLSLASQTFRRLLPGPETFLASRQSGNSMTYRSLTGTIAICFSIAFLAVGVRLLLWQDNRPDFPLIFSGMVQHHKANAHVLLQGEITQFITGPAPPGDANILTYPPGYPIIMALVFRLCGESDASMRIFQILCDAAAAVLLFFVAAEVLPRKAAVIAGTLAALSPQLAYYSLLLLPDSMATLPVLLGLYFVIRAIKSQSFWTFFAAGASVGLSCWLRSNALLLAPFLAIIIVLLRGPRRRWTNAAAFAGATLLVIAPITIRNLVVFHHLIPLSLGAGQMLNVGIGDYDKERRFGLPGTDFETGKSEAARYNRPDYARSLFGGNGVDREQDRISRGLAVVRSHPFWFGSVVLRRALSMFKLERVRPVSSEPAPTHSLGSVAQGEPAWSKYPADLIASGPQMHNSKLSASADGNALQIETDAGRREGAIASFSIAVERNSDYLFRLPVRVESGNLMVSVLRSSQGKPLASSPVLHPLETSGLFAQTALMLEVPFVNRDSDSVLLVLSNEGKRPVQTTAQVGRMELFRLGTASFVWARYLRVFIHGAQGFFLSAWVVPLALVGVLLLLAADEGRFLLILLAIPLYYICTQSFLHTEYRYVMAIQYSLFVLTAATLYWLGFVLIRMIRARSRWA